MPGLFERLLRAALGPLLPGDDTGNAREPDPMETRAGIHLLHGTSAAFESFSETVDADTVLAAIRSVDWDADFCQVFIVPRPGVWLEVGGSLDPQHGLSAMYVHRGDRVESVIRLPPRTLAEMEDIALTFLASEDALFDAYPFP
ncbi:MAG: hypothetical protein LCH70_03410 [Proteobacteria bacterium]|nr:hypothetical protein [Pseudomonadota bacterium]